MALAGCAAPLSAGAGEGALVERATTLTRATKWMPVAAIRLPFRTFHPQGMVRIGETFFVSAVEVREPPRRLAAAVDGHDRTAGAGIGHLFKIAPDGRLLADLILGEGTIYHPGGIDWDGTSIWVPVAEYRPDSRAIVYRVDPVAMTAREAFRADDHIGAVVHDRAGGGLIGLSWGSRRFYRWPDGSAATAGSVAINPAHYIDYQDCHYAGDRVMACAGVAEYRETADRKPYVLGGIELIDLKTLRPLWQVPVELRAPSGRPMTQNPFWIEPAGRGLRAWFMPDDDASTLYAFDAVTG